MATGSPFNPSTARSLSASVTSSRDSTAKNSVPCFYNRPLPRHLPHTRSEVCAAPRSDPLKPYCRRRLHLSDGGETPPQGGRAGEAPAPEDGRDVRGGAIPPRRPRPQRGGVAGGRPPRGPLLRQARRPCLQRRRQRPHLPFRPRHRWRRGQPLRRSPTPPRVLARGACLPRPEQQPSHPQARRGFAVPPLQRPPPRGGDGHRQFAIG
ncbi:hypothetical protein BS78_03G130900 [Paspalum vaginatum]|nr:hypothetical protein BS78_03G130900 [Paspalum vaginatum]